jgi:hypothetical protein
VILALSWLQHHLARGLPFALSAIGCHMSSLVIPMEKGVITTYLRGVVGENPAFQCLFWFTFWLLTVSFSGYHFNRSSLSFVTVHFSVLVQVSKSASGDTGMQFSSYYMTRRKWIMRVQ